MSQTMTPLTVAAIDKPHQASAPKLIPDDMAQLIGGPPTIRGEKVEDYQRLLANLVAELSPEGLVEWLLVKDLADATWESSRLKAMKGKLIDLSLIDTAIGLMEPILKRQMKSGADAMGMAIALLSKNGSENPAATRKAREVLAFESMDEGAVVAATFRDDLDTHERFAALIAQLDKRRDHILRDLGQRKAQRSIRRSPITQTSAGTMTLVDEAE